MKDANSLIHLFCLVQLKLTHAMIDFSPKEWKQALSAVVSFKQKNNTRAINQQNTIGYIHSIYCILTLVKHCRMDSSVNLNKCMEIDTVVVKFLWLYD